MSRARRTTAGLLALIGLTQLGFCLWGLGHRLPIVKLIFLTNGVNGLLLAGLIGGILRVSQRRRYRVAWGSLLLLLVFNAAVMGVAIRSLCWPAPGAHPVSSVLALLVALTYVGLCLLLARMNGWRAAP